MRLSGEVLVCQPYLPEYRVPLFEGLAVELRARGFGLVVAHGLPMGGQARRGDARQSAPWARRVPTPRLSLFGGVTFTWKRVGGLAKRADVIVCELATTDLNAWHQLGIRSRRVIVWGHGKSYTREPRAPQAMLEAVMAKRAAHVMSYTESGRQSLIARGVPPSRVTAVGNSTDTVLLRALQERFDEGQRAHLREQFRIPAHCALFVGGLDADKRISFLLAAARHAYMADPQFALVVAGAGTALALVEAVAGEPWIRWVRRVDAEQLAGLSTVVQSVWNPGRIGLIGVDALALALPVFTTRFHFHAPEYDYLRPGVDVFHLADNPAEFSQEALAKLAQWRMHGRPISTTAVPTVGHVARRMAIAIEHVGRAHPESP